MTNIILDNIKVAIFDFDTTLAIHNSFYEDIEPCTKSDKLYELITFLKNKGVKLYCLSGMRFSFHLKAKQNFVNKYYGDDIEFISAKNQETKVDAVKIIGRINNCNVNEILFVDDIEENIIRLKDIGVHSLLPDEVESLLNSIK